MALRTDEGWGGSLHVQDEARGDAKTGHPVWKCLESCSLKVVAWLKPIEEASRDRWHLLPHLRLSGQQER
jgi:hypothetical protein